MFGVWLIGSDRDVLVSWLRCCVFGIFVIVGFWSHLKIAMCFACLVAKKMHKEKQWENLLNLGWCSWFLIQEIFRS